MDMMALTRNKVHRQHGQRLQYWTDQKWLNRLLEGTYRNSPLKVLSGCIASSFS